MIIEKKKIDIKTIIKLILIVGLIIILFSYHNYLNKDSKKNVVSKDGVPLKELNINDDRVTKLYDMVRVSDLSRHPDNYYSLEVVEHALDSENMGNTIVSYIFLNNYNWDFDNVTCDDSVITTLTQEDIKEALTKYFGEESLENHTNNVYISYNNKYDSLFTLSYSRDSNNYVLKCSEVYNAPKKINNKIHEAYISKDGTEIRIVEEYEIEDNENIHLKPKGKVTFMFLLGKKNEYYLYKIENMK